MKLLSATDVNWIEIQVAPFPSLPSALVISQDKLLTEAKIRRMGHRKLQRVLSPLQRSPRARNRRNDVKSRSNERA
jgi:hypothetical protein